MRGGVGRPAGSEPAGSSRASGTAPSSITSVPQTSVSGGPSGIAGTSSTANSTDSSLAAQRPSRCSTASSTMSSNCSARLRDSGTPAGTSMPRRPRPRRSRRTPGRVPRRAGAGRSGGGVMSRTVRRATRPGGTPDTPRSIRSRHDRAGDEGAGPRPVPGLWCRRGWDLLGSGGAVDMVRHVRRCSRTGCADSAVATLTYVYSDSTAVVGPLATYAEPHSYDLCEEHARRLTVPKGWEVVRHEGDYSLPMPSSDDLEALADAVAAPGSRAEPGTGRRGHLRVIPSPP